MSTRSQNSVKGLSELDTITQYARSNIEWDKVYEYILVNPKDFFLILPGRRWSIGHQIAYHGNVERFKRFLSLFSCEDIDIRSKTADDKTIFDIALSKRNTHPEMYAYIEYLFMQDELMREAKQSNWRSVIEILEQQNQLANEKPLYSPCFLLHYVVEYGTVHILEELLTNYHCVTNLRNDKNETPLELAIRLGKHDMRSILEQHKIVSPQISPSMLQRPVTPPTNPLASNEMSTCKQNDSQSVISSLIGFQKLLMNLNLNLNSNSGHDNSNLTNSSSSASAGLTDQQQGQNSSEPRSAPLYKSIIRPCYSSGSDTTPSPMLSSTEESPSHQDMMRNSRCFITGKVMLDPVMASDGQSYERAAIIDWLNVFACSPYTGKPMDTKFEDNIQIKTTIQSLARQNFKS